MDFRRRQQRIYTPLIINGFPVEKVSSFKYLGEHISEDLTWTNHIQAQVKKARQRLYHLRLLRKFKVSPRILKTFYFGAIESILTQCISLWYGNSSAQDRKALQRVVRSAERTSRTSLCKTSTPGDVNLGLLRSSKTPPTLETHCLICYSQADASAV